MGASYEEMLKRGREKIPEKVLNKERYEIPKVRGHIQGNKTIISNFSQIIDILGRELEQVLKYLQKELATPAEYKNGLLILGRKVSASAINSKIESYAKEFVICKECGKPETKIVKEGDFYFLRCLACGAKHSVRGKI